MNLSETLVEIVNPFEKSISDFWGLWHMKSEPQTIMDSQQMVEAVSQNSQDLVLAKPTSSTPRHSIESILGLQSRKRSHSHIDDSGIGPHENTGDDFSLLHVIFWGVSLWMVVFFPILTLFNQDILIRSLLNSKRKIKVKIN